MRITNKIMQNNSLSNINTNKILQDKLNTQITTEKKITRPSDDPVIAIRALRLRGTLTDLTQYYEKNASDAGSWLEATETALGTLVDVISNMLEQCNAGANDNYESIDKKALLSQLSDLRNEIYSVGDSDFAGRNIFTGYRTSTKLTFQNDTSQIYRVTEQLSKDSMDKLTYINTAGLESMTGENYNQPPYNAIEEQDISDKEITRIRLGYDNLDNGYTPTITDHAGQPISFTDSSGNPANVTTTTVSLYASPSPYDSVGDDDVIFVPETGELLIGKNVSDKMASMVDNPLTQGADEGEIRITYDKSDWNKGDLNPVHYYACSTMTETTTGTPPVTTRNEDIAYNGGWQTGDFEPQVIEYDVGFNQRLRVNTTADECFNQSIGRDVDELIKMVEEVSAIEGVVDTLKKKVDADPTDTDAADALKAAEKAFTLMKDKMQKMFSGNITNFQTYLDRANNAVTNCGTRDARLDLVKSRLTSQLTTFDNLASENENADTTQLAIELSSAELSYEAALLATGKIVQTTLLNFL